MGALSSSRVLANMSVSQKLPHDSRALAQMQFKFISIITPVSPTMRKQEDVHLSRRRKPRFQLAHFRFSPHLAQQVCIILHNNSGV